MFEEVAEEGPSQEALDGLAAIVKKVARITHDLAGAEALVADLKAQLLDIKRGALPEALEKAKLPSVTTEMGRTITRKQIISGNWPKETAVIAKAVKWLQDNDLADLMKTTITVEFNKGDAELVTKVFTLLKDHPGANSFKSLERKDTVHNQTLNAMLRERLEKGLDTPLELFSGYTAWVADISEPSKAKGKK